MSRVLIAKSASGTHTDSRTSSNLETPKLRDETKLPEHGEDLGFGIASATLLTVSGGEVDRSGDHKIVWLWFNYSDTSDIGLQYHVQRVLPSVARAGAIELEKLGEVIRRLWGCDSWITRERFLSFDRGKRRYERFRDEIVAMLRDEPIEDGETHSAEAVIAKALRSDSGACRDWLSRILVGHYGKCPAISASLVRCIGRLEFDESGTWGMHVADDALKHPEAEVREAAVRALETWGGREALVILGKHNDPIAWLDEYVKEVIVDLSRASS